MIKRNTVQRAMVLETVRKLHCHATADEIYADIIQTCPTISRATIYRNLRLLCEAGEIRKVEIPGSPDRFDQTAGDHCHARCARCGKVIDVEIDGKNDILSEVKNSCGFILTGCDIIFRGVCLDCQAINRTKNVHVKGDSNG